MVHTVLGQVRPALCNDGRSRFWQRGHYLEPRLVEPEPASVLRRTGSLFLLELGLYPQHGLGQPCHGTVVSQLGQDHALSEFTVEPKGLLSHSTKPHGGGCENPDWSWRNRLLRGWGGDVRQPRCVLLERQLRIPRKRALESGRVRE